MSGLVLLPPVTIAALLLVLSALTIVREPGTFRAALTELGLPSGRLLVAVVAVGELALGTAGAIAPTRAVCAGIAAVYGVLAVVVIVQRRRPEVSACGCLGGTAPPSRVHLVLDAVLAAAALAAVMAPPASLWELIQQSPAAVVVVLLGIVAATLLAAFTIRELPELLDLTRGTA